MRVMYFIMIAGLILPLGACGGPNQGPPPGPPPPVNRELLVGAWTAPDKEQFVQKVEFAADGSLKTAYKDMPQVLAGKYSWSDDRTLVVEYQLSDADKKAYQATAAKQRDLIRPGLEKTNLGKEGAKRLVAQHYPDELAAKQSLHVGLTENELFVKTDEGLQLSFKRTR